jgi:hypothetical protein
MADRPHRRQANERSPARAPEAKKTDSPTPTFYDLDSSWRRNQNAVAKTIDIFDLRFGITIDDAWAQLPQALVLAMEIRSPAERIVAA